MSTLEEHFVNKGFREGFREGFRDGFQKEFQKEFQKGFQEGFQEGKVEIVQKMLAQGFAFEVIKTCTGLTLQKIKEVADSLTQAKTSHTVGTSASS